MVGGHTDPRLAWQARQWRAGNTGQLRGQALEAPQTARRFRQLILTLPRRGHGLLVEWLDTLDHCLQLSATIHRRHQAVPARVDLAQAATNRRAISGAPPRVRCPDEPSRPPLPNPSTPASP